MKQAVLFSAMGILASASGLATAEEVGRVLSTTPVMQQVAVPRQVCSQPMAVQQPSSGGGAGTTRKQIEIDGLDMAEIRRRLAKTKSQT